MHFVFLGCPKNRVDSEAALAGLVEAGFTPVADAAAADYLLLNTCSFIGAARDEARTEIRRLAALRRARPGVRLVVLGCWVSLAGEQLRAEFPEVDLLVGSERIDSLAALLRASGPAGEASAAAATGAAAPGPAYQPGGHYLGPGLARRTSSLGPASAYLKVADGCSRACAFCLIPSIKGPLVCRPQAQLLAEAAALVQGGVRELVLVGQDLSSWRDGERGLPDLLRALARLDGLAWLRPLYLYPGPNLSALARLGLEEPKLVPYLDLPLQHIDAGMLRRMRRGYGEQQARDWVAEVRALRPGMFVRTGFIVGHPGEGEAEFARLQAFLDGSAFPHVSIFPFSPEPGTASHDQPGRLPEPVVQARFRALEQTHRHVLQRLGHQLEGRRLPVLLTDPPGGDHPGLWAGRHWGQAPEVDGRTLVAVAPGTTGDLGELRPGTVVQARIYSSLLGNCWGRA